MLIKNIIELKANSEVNGKVNFDSVRMSIEEAEIAYIIPVIGYNLYDDLNTIHEVNGGTPEQQALVKKIQKALGSLALYEFVPFADATISDVGIRRTGTADQPGAYKHQVSKLEASYLARGLNRIEDLLLFLEINAGDYPIWTSSAEFAEYRKLFIRTGSEFASVYTGVKHPRQTFLKLRGALLHVQENIICPTILQDIYDDLLVKLAAPSIGFTADDKVLVKHIQRAMAYLGMKEGFSEYAVSIDANGVTVLNDKIDTTQGDVSKRAAASDNQIRVLTANCHNTGYTWLNRAIEFLDEKASDSVYVPWYEKMEAEKDTKGLDINESLGGSYSL